MIVYLAQQMISRDAGPIKGQLYHKEIAMKHKQKKKHDLILSVTPLLCELVFL